MDGYEKLRVTLPDGYQAYGRYWSPDQPRGAVLYHHGIQSHCGWYETSPARLVESGYAVLQVDRRGSGRNDGDRGHSDSVEQLLGDSHAARDELLRRCGLPTYHMFGVSWGGKWIVAAHVDDPTGVAGLTLVAPGLFPVVGVSKKQKAKIGFMMLYEPHKTFPIPLNDAELFTKNVEWQRFFDTDERTLRACTASFYLASRRMDKIATRLPKAPPVPVHLLLAGDERIIDNDKTGAFVRDLRWPKTRITTYEKARHSLEFEDDPEVYFADVVRFLDDVTP